MYDDISDYELLDKVSDNEIATEKLFEKYKPLIHKIANKFYYRNQIAGFELNDLIQEGMVGFSVALNTYDQNKEASFFTFAKLCIIRKMLTFISSANRQKHQLLNESISVERFAEETKQNEVIFSDNGSNPENLILSLESTKEMMNEIEKELTTFESEVFELKTAGFDNNEIAELLDKEKKSIINAVSRIKAKINNYLKNRK